LARTNPAARDLMKFRGRARTPAMVNRARSALARVKDPAQKVALSRSIRTSHFLRSSQMRTLVKASRGWSARGRNTLDRLLGGGPVSGADVSFLRGQFLGASGPLRGALGSALRDASFLRSQGAALDGLAAATGGAVMPGGGYSPGSAAGADVPEVPSVLIPEDEGDPNGPGVNLSVTPGEESGGLVGPPEVDPTGEVVQSDQTTRRLRLGNNTRNKVKFFVQYQNGKGRENWYPARPNGEGENALEYELEPGQTIDVQDNDWRVSANKVRVWARGGGQEWNRFKNRDLPAVPEKDSYKAPGPQDLNFIVH
jgi:hypothetical protein